MAKEKTRIFGGIFAAFAFNLCSSACLKSCVSIWKYTAPSSPLNTPIVPITGFANAIVSPAIEYKSEGLILGLGAKLFVIAGPVLVYGITASVLYGLVLLVLKGGGAG